MSAFLPVSKCRLDAPMPALSASNHSCCIRPCTPARKLPQTSVGLSTKRANTSLAENNIKVVETARTIFIINCDLIIVRIVYIYFFRLRETYFEHWSYDNRPS